MGGVQLRNLSAAQSDLGDEDATFDNIQQLDPKILSSPQTADKRSVTSAEGGAGTTD